jgi:hypothetical protein
VMIAVKSSRNAIQRSHRFSHSDRGSSTHPSLGLWLTAARLWCPRLLSVLLLSVLRSLTICGGSFRGVQGNRFGVGGGDRSGGARGGGARSSSACRPPAGMAFIFTTVAVNTADIGDVRPIDDMSQVQ